MEEESKRIVRIRKTLLTAEYTYDELSEKDKNYLDRIETAIQEVFDIEEKAKHDATKNMVSVKGVADALGISRQTIYNNELLKRYIEIRSNDFNKIDMSKQLQIKEEYIKHLEEVIKNYQKRDVEIMELKSTIRRKDNTIKNQQTTIDNLRNSRIKRNSNIGWN